MFVANSLVDMYAKCGLPLEARDVFDALPEPDIVSWTALISGFAEQGLEVEALDILEEMKSKGLFPSEVTLFCGLKACASIGALQEGQQIHTDIVYAGFENNLSVGNTLIDMYGKCGCMEEAQIVFSGLPSRDVVSWTGLIAGYVELELADKALECFEEMEEDGVFPDPVAFMYALKACSGAGNIERGQQIHMDVIEDGLERNYLVATSLVDMYSKFGLFAEAHDVLYDFPVRDIVAWNALIVGYVEHGLTTEAFSCVNAMQQEGLPLNPFTLVSCLKISGTVNDIDNGLRLHDQVIKHGMENNAFIENSLIYMYAKCGMLSEGQKEFDNLTVRETIPYNNMIAGFSDHGFGEEALLCWEQMQKEGVHANAITFLYVLKACSILENVTRGQESHMHIVKMGFEEETIMGNVLVDMYFKCATLLEAFDVFENLNSRDTASWNAVIIGCVEYGLAHEALEYFKKMQEDNICLDEVTYVGVLKAVTSLEVVSDGMELHAHIVKDDMEMNLIIGNTLIDMYGKMGMLEEAHDVFDMLLDPDVISWSALISGYVEHKLYETALSYFETMRCEGVSPTALLFIYALNACSGLKALQKGQDIENKIITVGLEKDEFVGVAVIGMYAKCGQLLEAEKTFMMLSEQNAAAWTTLIAGFSEHGLVQETLDSLECMKQAGFTPDPVCFLCALKACVSIGAIGKGKELHADIIIEGLETEIYLGNSLVDMYGKFGSIVEAQDVFDELVTRDVVSWTALITGYAEHGHPEVAFQCLEQMQMEGVTPTEAPWNAVILAFSERDEIEDAFSVYARMQEQGMLPDSATYVSIFRACGRSAALSTGRRFHSQILNIPMVNNATGIPITSLVDMYGKCGSMIDAKQAFDTYPCRDIVRWNTLMNGFARHEQRDAVFSLWKQMSEIGLANEITLLSVLSLCSHAGLVDKGQRLFETMSQEYGDAIVLKHYSCMADLFGRAGQIDEALEILDMMPAQADSVAWSTVLGACSNWGNPGLTVHTLDLLPSINQFESSIFTSIPKIQSYSQFLIESGYSETNEALFDTRHIG
ncbi:hypothetical protein KP509_06G003600 [Ceratopteris richardii]|nr:hypothetical protein KP509_06G003600 [Ceratopteris richardii]